MPKSEKEKREACYEVATNGVLAIAKQFVPWMFESQAEEAIRNNPDQVRNLVDEVLEEYNKNG